MATLSAIRSGLADRIETITTLASRTHDKWPNNLTPPAAIIKRGRSKRYTTFASNGAHFFEITMVVQIPAGDIERAQVDLDEYTDLSGTKSIMAAIEGDQTLGSNAEYVLLGDWGEDETIKFPDGGPEYLSAVLPVEVHLRY